MEKRVLLAVFLSFLVLVLYQAVVVPPSPQMPVQPESGRGSAPAADAGAPSASSADRPVPTPPAAASSEPAVEVQSVVSDHEPRDIVVESDLVRAVFSNRGGLLISWQLMNYLDGGTPVELVPRGLPPEEPWPFSLDFEDPAVTARVTDALFKPSRASVRVSAAPEVLSFEYEDSTGLRVRKTFEFDPASPYELTVAVHAAVGSEMLSPRLKWGPALGGVEVAGSGFAGRQGSRGLFYGRPTRNGVLEDLDVWRLDASDVASASTYRGPLVFVGVDNHYFLGAALTANREVEVRYRPVAIPPPPGTTEGGRNLIAFDLTLPAEPTAFFVGPKDFDVLAAVHRDLVRAIDFGMFAWLVVPLHRSLKWVNSYVGNYGWSIIILTVMINALIFPLRHMSVVSMRKMQEVQPELKAIQERYSHLKATDPAKQKMNQEVMELYRQRGVNPASGCLPMLFTMPILLAFYALLSAAIEIRGAPFILWIQDLSAHDPFYVTPIIMGATMVVQQRMTPVAADPMQQKMMMIMPVVFTFMFLWFPSGLVIYWLTSNVLGIVQQVVTNRIIGPPKVRTVRPAAERHVKKARPGGNA